ncbi:acetolactate synthase [Backusella circina FSU 941]|nr:acetolactate synthase [Backusella circina FSU 941]
MATAKRHYVPALSAMAFKTHMRQRKYGPVPIHAEITAEDAVSNILYNTPKVTSEPPKRHVLNCLVQNEPGVLSKLSGVLAGRNFNIESLVVANTEVPDLSRMTIVFKGKDDQIEQARRQLEDLVPVWAVLDYTRTKLVERELLLIKLSILGPDNLHEQMPTAKFDETVEFSDDVLNHETEHEELSPSKALRETFDHLRAVTELSRLFNGKIIDVASDAVMIQVCAKPERITSFMRLCKPFGILEASRTGVMAMPRSPVFDHYLPQTEHSYSDDDGKVDESLLPPG